jgi:hypothetical protein
MSALIWVTFSWYFKESLSFFEKLTFTRSSVCLSSMFKSTVWPSVRQSVTLYILLVQRQLLVSNIQGFDLSLYDSTVGTEDGILDDNDLGYDEISVIVSKFKESEPTVIAKKYLSPI